MRGIQSLCSTSSDEERLSSCNESGDDDDDLKELNLAMVDLNDEEENLENTGSDSATDVSVKSITSI